MKQLAFDARTIGDHYPGIGRYACGVRQALGERVAYSIIDPTLPNTRFEIGGSTKKSWGVRSLLSQIDLPLKLGDADIYYSPYFLMPYVVRCVSVVTLYDATPLYGSEMNATGKLIFRLANFLAGRVADRVIVLSESAKEDMATLGVPREKMVVCPPGLDVKFCPQDKTEIERLKINYGLPDEFVLCFGSKKWHKNTKALLEIGDWNCVVVGGDFNEIRNTHYVSYIEESDLPALFSSATALIFPSLREGFGLPIIEAMACGTPVVCLPAPGVKETAGGAAVMADDLTDAALAQAASRLRDPIFREEKRIAGLEWVKRYTWEKTVQVICNW
jgi:alpha-1,3-rhamnosyl/mannosyltransferase